jgi:hypothetical protein
MMAVTKTGHEGGHMEVIEATYRVVTPMFCSGADQSKAELRLHITESVKKAQ